jgi:hypothetical protein
MWKWIAEFSEILSFNMVSLSICDIKTSGQLVEFAPKFSKIFPILLFKKQQNV